MREMLISRHWRPMTRAYLRRHRQSRCAPRRTPPQPDAAKPAKPGKVEPDAPPPDDTPDAAPAGKVHGVMPAPSVAKPKEPSPPPKRPADPADEPLTTRNKPSRDKPNSLHLPGEEEAEDSNAVYKISARRDHQPDFDKIGHDSFSACAAGRIAGGDRLRGETLFLPALCGIRKR